MGDLRIRLFGLRYEVELRPSHPQYFEKRAGILSIWIMAMDEEEAFTNAFMILELLPYSLISTDVGFIDCATCGFETEHFREAQAVGLKVVWEPVGLEVDWSGRWGEEAG